MSPFDENFNWVRFFQFSLPYGLLMAIINPQWGLFAIFFSAACFGFVLTILLQPPAPPSQEELEHIEKGELPQKLFIGHTGAKRNVTAVLSVMGLCLFGMMGTISLFIDLIDPQGAENFSKTLHVSFFYGLCPIFWATFRGLSSYGLITNSGVEIFEKLPIYGEKKKTALFSQISSAQVTYWGSVQVNFRDGESLKFGAIIGNDLSYYKELDIPETEIHNPNFRASYQLCAYLNKKAKEGITAEPSEQKSAA